MPAGDAPTPRTRFASTAGRLVRARRRVGRAVEAGYRDAVRPLRAATDRRRSPVTPVLVVVEPAHDPEAVARAGHDPLFAGRTPRFATCSDVAWMRPDRLVTAHLLTGSVTSYEFGVRAGRPHLRRLGVHRDPTIPYPTSLAVAPDGTRLAVANQTVGVVAVLDVDPETGDLVAGRARTVGVDGDVNLHGVAFAPDGRHLVYTAIRPPGHLRVVRVDAPGGALGVCGEVVGARPDLVAKSVCFTTDGRHLLVAYGANASFGPRDKPPGRLEVREWSAAGAVGPVVATTPPDWASACAEGVAASPDGTYLVTTDNFGDQVLVVGYDPATGTLGATEARIGWAAGGVRAPHGCAVSPDGCWIAVTSYGDGSLRLFRAADVLGARGAVHRESAPDAATRHLSDSGAITSSPNAASVSGGAKSQNHA